MAINTTDFRLIYGLENTFQQLDVVLFLIVETVSASRCTGVMEIGWIAVDQFATPVVIRRQLEQPPTSNAAQRQAITGHQVLDSVLKDLQPDGQAEIPAHHVEPDRA